MATRVERVSGSCLELLSLCHEHTAKDREVHNELVIMMSESRSMVELCKTLAQDGIRDTEEIEHFSVSIFLTKFFSKIYAFEKRLEILIRSQADKRGIIQSYGFNVGHEN